MTKNVRRGGFGRPSGLPNGYVWADRLIDVGEKILVYSKDEWVKVEARSTLDWWGKAKHWQHPHYPVPISNHILGGVSFIDPLMGEMSYYTALRVKEKWVEDGTPPHGGRHEAIGLHDPNPYVCIKGTGDKPIELDSKGLPYYPISESEMKEHWDFEGRTEVVTQRGAFHANKEVTVILDERPAN